MTRIAYTFKTKAIQAETQLKTEETVEEGTQEGSLRLQLKTEKESGL